MRDVSFGTEYDTRLSCDLDELARRTGITARDYDVIARELEARGVRFVCDKPLITLLYDRQPDTVYLHLCRDGNEEFRRRHYWSKSPRAGEHDYEVKYVDG